MSKKIRVAVLFGGRSAEHEVSLQSARNVIAAIDKQKYEVIPIGIDKLGQWHHFVEADFLLNAGDPKLIALRDNPDQIALALRENQTEIINIANCRSEGGIDVVFPVLHGPYGEDGTIQGLLKLANLPFVGPGVLGSAVGMDKDTAKRLLRDAGLPIAKFLSFKSGDRIDYDAVEKSLGLPLFIKPANLGSSVGISKVKDKIAFDQAVLEAFQYDSKIIIEEMIAGRELECSVLGNEEPVASLPGEVVIDTAEFYSYEAKYIDESWATLKVPAELSLPIEKKVQDLAVKTFKTLECEGMARVDFFLKDDGEVIINEINTIPGFTKISMYPKMWEVSGLPYPELIDRLIQLAIERFERERKLKTDY